MIKQNWHSYSNIELKLLKTCVLKYENRINTKKTLEERHIN